MSYVWSLISWNVEKKEKNSTFLSLSRLSNIGSRAFRFFPLLLFIYWPQMFFLLISAQITIYMDLSGLCLLEAALTTNGNFPGIRSLQGFDALIALEQVGGTGGGGLRRRNRAAARRPWEIGSTRRMNGSGADWQKGEQEGRPQKPPPVRREGVG